MLTTTTDRDATGRTAEEQLLHPLQHRPAEGRAIGTKARAGAAKAAAKSRTARILSPVDGDKEPEPKRGGGFS